jgi:hypothetical protein
MSHVSVIWIGSSYQVYYVFSNRTAENITKLWVLCLLYAQIAALPRCLKSEYLVWKLCHIVGAILMTALTVGVILYG